MTTCVTIELTIEDGEPDLEAVEAAATHAARTLENEMSSPPGEYYGPEVTNINVSMDQVRQVNYDSWR